MPKKGPTQAYCNSCWAKLPAGVPRIVEKGQWMCGDCAYRLRMAATNVGVCSR